MSDSCGSSRMGQRGRWTCLALVIIALSGVAIVGGAGVATAQAGACDVVVQDGESVQDAINGSAADATVCLETGTYAEELTVDVEGLTLTAADGATPVLNGTDSQTTAITATAPNVTVSGIAVEHYSESSMILSGASNATVRDVNVSKGGYGSDVHGIVLDGASNTTVVDTAVSDHEYGVHVTNADDVTVENVTSTKNEDGVYAKAAANVLVTDSTLSDNANGVGFSTNTDNSAVVNSTLLDNGQGVTIYDTANVSVTNNTVRSQTDEGVQIGQSLDIVVRDNDIDGSDNQQIGVLIDRVSERVTFADNTVSNFGYEGMRVEESHNLTISGNVIENNSQRAPDYTGIHLLNSNGTALADNEIRDNQYLGIHLDWREDGITYGTNADVVVENNTISGHAAAVELDEAINATVADNTFETGVIFQGEVLEHFDHAFEGNTVAGDPLFYANGLDTPTVPENAGQIVVVDSSNVHVTDRTFENIAAGVQIAYSDGTVVENTTLSSTGHAYFRTGAITAWQSSDVRVSDVDVAGGDGYGLIFHDSQNPTVEHTTVNATVRQGVWLLGTTGAVLTNVSVSNSVEENGIHLDSGSHNATITKSSVTGNNLDGVMLRDSNGATVTNTTVSENARGITTYEAEDVLIRGNDVARNDEHGIGPADAAVTHVNLTIEANVVTGNVVGVETHGSTVDATVADNVVTSSATVGIDAGAGLIENNTVSDSGTHGIIAEPGTVISTNTITNSGEHGIEASGGDLHNNTVADNGKDGVYLDGYSDDRITNNTVSGHAVGLRFVDSTNVTVANNSFESGVTFSGPYSPTRENYDHAFADNTVGGAPLAYAFGADGPTIPADAGQVILADATNVSIENVTFSEIATPIQIAFSDNVSVDNATVMDASDDGIHVASSQTVTLNATTVTGSGGHGLYLGEAGPITLTESEFSANVEHGIWAELVDSPERSTIANSTISANTDGISFYQHADVINVTVRDTVLTDNDRGIAIASDVENVRIDGNSIVDNAIGLEYDLDLGGPTTLDARDNWWGDASGPSGGATDAVNASVSADGSGDSIELPYGVDDTVRFDPWLATAPVAIPSASFDVTNATVDETSLQEGDSVTATVDVTNTGTGTGTYAGTLAINGTDEQTASESLTPGSTTEVTFTHTFPDAGAYAVSVDGLAAGTVTVADTPAPAATIDVTDATVNATSVDAGASASVTADVANTGNAMGTDTASLEINGSVEATTSVQVDAGSTEQVTFTHTFPDAGTYAVSVDGVAAGTVLVEAPGDGNAGSTDGGDSGQSDDDDAGPSDGAGPSGGGGGGSSGGAGSGPSASDPEQDTSVSVADTTEGASVEVTDAAANEPVTIPMVDTQPTTAVDLTALEITPTEDADFEVSVEASEDPPADAGTLPQSAEAVVYLDVEHDLEDGQIGGAAFEFAVSTDELEARGIDPEDVVLYHLDDGTWTERETAVIADGPDSVAFRAQAPHFSWFAIGGTAPLPEEGEGQVGEETASEPATAGDAADPAQGTSSGFGPLLPWIAVVLAVAVVAIAVLVRRRR